MSIASSSQLKNGSIVAAKSSCGSRLSYEVINLIFDYLSMISDSGWFLKVTNNGKLMLLPNPWFFDLHHLFRFKTETSAREVKLNIQPWDAFHEQNMYDMVVTALEQPHRIHHQNVIDTDASYGIFSDNRCYTYIDPTTEQNVVAYVEIRKHNNISVFNQGCVYEANGETKVISGFSSDETPGNVRVVINPYNITWDYEGNPNWEEELEAAEALLDIGGNVQHQDQDYYDEDEQDNEIDFDELEALQMYM